METVKVSQWEFENAIDSIVEQIGERKFVCIVAVLRGGLVPARWLAGRLGIEKIEIWEPGQGPEGYNDKVLVVDDMTDTGKTLREIRKLEPKVAFASIVSKASGADYTGIEMDFHDSRWVVFPWEGPADKVGVRQSGE